MIKWTWDIQRVKIYKKGNKKKCIRSNYQSFARAGKIFGGLWGRRRVEGNQAFVILTPEKKAKTFCVSLLRGLYFGLKTIFILPLLKMIFFPLLRHVVFLLPPWPICLSLPYFAFILPFSHFLSPFFLFLLHFPSISLPLFIFFSPKWHQLIFPPPGRVFSNIAPESAMYCRFSNAVTFL